MNGVCVISPSDYLSICSDSERFWDFFEYVCADLYLCPTFRSAVPRNAPRGQTAFSVADHVAFTAADLLLFFSSRMYLCRPGKIGPKKIVFVPTRKDSDKKRSGGTSFLASFSKSAIHSTTVPRNSTYKNGIHSSCTLKNATKKSGTNISIFRIETSQVVYRHKFSQGPPQSTPCTNRTWGQK